jgi:hypothetical protein
MDMLVSGGGAARSCTTLRSRSRSRSRSRHMGFTSKRSSYAGSASVSTQGPRPRLRLAWRPSWRAAKAVLAVRTVVEDMLPVLNASGWMALEDWTGDKVGEGERQSAQAKAEAAATI